MNQLKAQTLDNFIRKYGDVVGRKKYEESNSKQFSNISLELFERIQEKLGDIGANARYGANEVPITVVFDNGITKNCYPDYLLNTRIIEFNGDYWHMNPKFYGADDKIPFGSVASSKFNGTTAGDIWKYDRNKTKALEKLGYSVKTVWEDDYVKNKDEVVSECLEFLLKQQ